MALIPLPATSKRKNTCSTISKLSLTLQKLPPVWTTSRTAFKKTTERKDSAVSARKVGSGLTVMNLYALMTEELTRGQVVTMGFASAPMTAYVKKVGKETSVVLQYAQIVRMDFVSLLRSVSVFTDGQVSTALKESAIPHVFTVIRSNQISVSAKKAGKGELVMFQPALTGVAKGIARTVKLASVCLDGSALMSQARVMREFALI